MKAQCSYDRVNTKLRDCPEKKQQHNNKLVFDKGGYNVSQKFIHDENNFKSSLIKVLKQNMNYHYLCNTVSQLVTWKLREHSFTVFIMAGLYSLTES